MSEVIVNGYPIGYRSVDGKLYVLADDLGGYFGYSRNKSNGRCFSVYADDGVGLCKPKVFLEFAGAKRLFYPYSSISRFAQLCTKERNSVANKLIILKERFSKIEVVTSPKEFPKSDEKVKLVCLNFNAGEYIAKFSNDTQKKVTLKKCSVDFLTSCSMTNKLIHANKEHLIFEVKRKGFGLYRIASLP